MQEYSKFLPAFTPYILHFTLYTLHSTPYTHGGIQYPCNILVIPLPLRYHSVTTLNLYRRNSERTPKEERSVVVPLWLRTPKEERSLINPKLPLRKGSARVAKMKVYLKGLFLTILEIQCQTNSVFTAC